MHNIISKFEPEITLACKDFEEQFEEESVCWGASLDFFPDVERSTEDNIPLVAAVGVYLEIPNTEDTVFSGSILVAPQLETEQIYTTVFNSLVALREQRSLSVK